MQRLLLILTVLGLFTSDAMATGDVLLANGEWAPYLSPNLPHYGAASHIVTEAFQAAGVSTTYHFYPWKRAYILAENGTCNGSLVWTHTPERDNLFVYSNVVIHESEFLFHLKSIKLEWRTIEDLKGLTIGATLHTSYPTLEEAEKKGILQIERAGNYDTLFKRLLRKRIDAIPMVSQVAAFYLRNTIPIKDQDYITFSDTVLQQRQYHLILTKQLQENKNLISRFNNGLAAIKENGKYDKIVQALKQGEYDLP